MTKELINMAAKRLSEEARAEYGDTLSRVFLFGSCARGDFDNESDIDMMILLNVDQKSINHELEKAISIASRVGEEFDYEVLLSPVVQSEDMFNKYLNVIPFYQNVMKEGVRYV